MSDKPIPWYGWLLLPVFLVEFAWEWIVDEMLCRPRDNPIYPIEK